MNRPGSLAWFARHELRLAWRDWLGMMTAGRRWRLRSVVIGIVVVAIVLHALAYGMVARYADVAGHPDKPTLVIITGMLLLSWALMLSQAMESVTRAFYARADLDLILSSPVAAARLFAVRIASMAVTVGLMAMLLAAPFVDVLVIRGGARWLGAYGVVVAVAILAVALAVMLSVALFQLIGPKRTRLVAQIVAAVIGAGFVIVLQFAAIMSYGSLSRFAILQSDGLVRVAPDAASPLWWPARAATGDVVALVLVCWVSLALLAIVVALFAPCFSRYAISAGGSSTTVKRQRRRTRIRHASPASALRHKEWTLLLRDPWLASQTLMQLLYLLPPAVLLWRSFGDGAGKLLILVPALVMAAGQLAGGLAWLAISGEDAPDLVAAAPVPPGRVMRAKTEAILGGMAFVFGPFIAIFALSAPFAALIAAAGIGAATASAVAIQFWFRTQAKRSHFRRRQTSSRVATFAEAFSSIGWAGAGAMAAAGTWFAAIAAIIALATLGAARLLSPPRV